MPQLPTPAPELAALRALLDDTLLRDRRRLQRELDQLAAKADNGDAFARWRARS